MKIQCNCGAKYVIEIQPEMLAQPVKFVCSSCGLDASAFVNELIRQELGIAAPPAAGDSAIAPPPAAIASSPPAAAPPPPQVRLHRGGLNPADAPLPTIDHRVCSKHPGQSTVERCLVCSKPICPKCMELFGYVCSPLCQQKAELQGIEVPEYAGQKSVVERRHWRKVAVTSYSIAAVVVAFVGLWIWYAWFGSTPSPSFSVRFPEPSYSGQSRLCGKDQIVFLHGDTLARYDLKTKKEIWSRQLVDKKQIEQKVAATIKAAQLARQKADSDNPDASDLIKIPSAEKLTKMLTREAEAALELHVRSNNVWVSLPDKLVRYDWDSGKPLDEIPLIGGLGGAIPRGDELLLLSANDHGQEVVTHLNLTTAKKTTEEIGEPLKPEIAGAGVPLARPGAGKSSSAAARPSDSAKPLDPGKVASQVQRMPLPGKIALPAVLATSANQERTLAAMRELDRDRPKPAPATEQIPAAQFSMIVAPDTFVQFAVVLLEEKIVARSAMKAPPKKSALDGAVSVTQTAEVANEILNEIQRSRGGDMVEEDESRYRVTVRLPCAKDVTDWTGEVVGPPALYPLKTVNVVAAGKTITVLDKTNKKKWQATLNYNVSAGAGNLDEENAAFGLGPVVERGDTLYVIDEGVLSAFDLATGNARWRLPSVGIAGIFFDDEGMIYVNSTSAGPEKIKYSRHIDVTDKTSVVVLKLDPKTGKTLWTAEPGGPISHLAGKFIYTIESYQTDDSDADNPYTPDTGFEKDPFMRIKRIHPRTGKVMWAHYQPRAPLDVQFHGNVINVVFKKEVQVLKFLSF